MRVVCWVFVGDEILPSYVGMIVNHDIRMPIKQPLGGGFMFFYFHPYLGKIPRVETQKPPTRKSYSLNWKVSSERRIFTKSKYILPTFCPGLSLRR